MDEDKITPLARHRAQVSADKRARVVATVGSLAERAGDLTITSVARAAGVSREFIHSYPDLHALVLGESQRRRERARVEMGEGPARTGAISEKSALINTVTRLRRQNAALQTQVSELETQRRRDLGMKLDALDAPTDAERLAAIALAERVQTENTRLQRELSDTVALVHQLTDDLAATRLALAEALSEREVPGTALRAMS